MTNPWLIALYLFLIALVPGAVSVGIYFLQKYTKFRNVNYWWQQIIIGVIFGLLAITATHVSIDVGGAGANIRDSGPLCAGLIFGGPAGLIAGFIGGFERLAIAFMNPAKFGYTAIACSVSTMIAGIYTFLLRKFMFDNKRPSWGFGFASAMVMEVFHMTMVFLTHMDDLTKSFDIIRLLSVPMIFTNGIAVLIPCLTLELIGKQRHKDRPKSKYKKLTHKIQGWMLVSVGIIFALTTVFTYFAQSTTSSNNCTKTLETNIADVVKDVKQSTENDIYEIAQKVKAQCEAWNASSTTITKQMLLDLAARTDIDINEIDIIEKKMHPTTSTVEAYITKSTVDSYVYMIMNNTAQTRPFNVLLPSSSEHVTFFVQEALPNGSQQKLMKYAGITIDNGQYESYVQVAYDYASYSTIIKNRVKNLSEVRHVGSSGKVVVADYYETIVSEKVEFGLPRTLTDMKFNSGLAQNVKYTGVLQLNVGVAAVECHYEYAQAEWFYIISAITTAEVNAGRDNMIYFTTFMEVIVLAILFAIIYKLLMHLVVNNLMEVNQDLSKIIGGNLDVTLDVKGSQEFASLSDDINSTVTTLKMYIEEAKHRIDDELKFAKSIQLSALPNNKDILATQDKVDILAKMFTAKEVGGDFYDFYLLDDHRIGFLIADVSGKGIPAAMFMMQSKATIKNYANKYEDTGEIMMHANEELCKENDAGMFVTCWFGIIDIKTLKITFTNAGHNPPLLYRKETNSWEYIKSKTGFVLAGLDISRYTQCELQLKPGDKLFLYTDGVTEATRGDNELYGEERLIKFLSKCKSKQINTYIDNIKNDIDKFVEDAPQFDDITMLLLECKDDKDSKQ